MKLLVDECLSPELAMMARARGYDASHVVWLGLAGKTDWDLMPTIVDGDWTFVTKNSVDFRGPASSPGTRGLHAQAAIHAGLICLNGPPGMDLGMQCELSEEVLCELAIDDHLINLALEITLDAGEIVSVRYAIPAL